MQPGVERICIDPGQNKTKILRMYSEDIFPREGKIKMSFVFLGESWIVFCLSAAKQPRSCFPCPAKQQGLGVMWRGPPAWITRKAVVSFHSNCIHTCAVCVTHIPYRDFDLHKSALIGRRSGAHDCDASLFGLCTWCVSGGRFTFDLQNTTSGVAYWTLKKLLWFVRIKLQVTTHLHSPHFWNS